MIPYDYFGDILCISLYRRRDRREELIKNIANCGWRFPYPKFYYANDAQQEGFQVPVGWQEKRGAYGCLLSHKTIMDYYIRTGPYDGKPLLVLEDDALFPDNIMEKLSDFIEAVPTDWDCLMFGGDHLQNPTIPINEKVHKCVWTWNTHAYAIKGRAVQRYFDLLSISTRACDYVLASMNADYNMYCPWPKFIINQRSSFSDVEDCKRQDRIL